MWLWSARVVWALLPVATGTAFSDALDGWPVGRARAAAVFLWAAWALGLLALFTPRPWGTTALAHRRTRGSCLRDRNLHVDERDVRAVRDRRDRCGRNSCPVGTGESARRATRSRTATRCAFRYASRPLSSSARSRSPSCWSSRAWRPVPCSLPMPTSSSAIPLTIAGFALAYVVARSLHSLSTRWLVIVPAGVALVDPLTLLDPVLVRREVIEGIRRVPGARAPAGRARPAPGNARWRVGDRPWRRGDVRSPARPHRRQHRAAHERCCSVVRTDSGARARGVAPDQSSLSVTSSRVTSSRASGARVWNLTSCSSNPSTWQRVQRGGGKLAEHRVLRVCIRQLGNLGASRRSAARDFHRDPFERDALYRRAGQARDRRRFARTDDLDVAEHDVAHDTGSGFGLPAAARAAPHGDRAAAVADRHVLDDDVFDIGAVDRLDRHAAGLVEVVQVGHAFVAAFARSARRTRSRPHGHAGPRRSSPFRS